MQDVTVVRTSVLPPYAAHLRVYEPLAAYPESERARWQAYAAERGPDAVEAAQPVAAAVLEEQREALAELAARTPRALPERESGRAYLRVVDGVLYVCPWATRLRSWQALEELRAAAPVALLDTAVPPVARAAAEADRERWRAGHPDARPWILTSRWEVPVRWFLPFGDEDRCFVPAQERGKPGRAAALFYLVPMAQARRRVARAFRALREEVPDGELVRGRNRSGGGWRNSIRARWWSWTTGGWCICWGRSGCWRTVRRGSWRRGSARCGRGTPRRRCARTGN